MADTLVDFPCHPGHSLTVYLYPRSNLSSSVNGDGYRASPSSADGIYLFTVQEPLKGWYKAIIKSGGATIATYDVWLNDDEGPYHCHDHDWGEGKITGEERAVTVSHPAVGNVDHGMQMESTPLIPPIKAIRIWVNRGTVMHAIMPNCDILPEEEIWNEAIDGPVPAFIDLDDFEMMQGLVREGDSLRLNAEIGKLRTKERDEFEAWQQEEAAKEQSQRDEAEAARIVALLKSQGIKIVQDQNPKQPTFRQQVILDAIGSGVLNGPQIAKKTGFTNNSSFRQDLAIMVDLGLLDKHVKGYIKKP